MLSCLLKGQYKVTSLAKDVNANTFIMLTSIQRISMKNKCQGHTPRKEIFYATSFLSFSETFKRNCLPTSLISTRSRTYLSIFAPEWPYSLLAIKPYQCVCSYVCSFMCLLVRFFEGQGLLTFFNHSVLLKSSNGASNYYKLGRHKQTLY